MNNLIVLSGHIDLHCSLFSRFFFLDKMPKEEIKTVQTGTSTLTLLLVAIIGGIVAISLQPLILLLYSHLGIPTAPISYQQAPSGMPVEQIPTTTIVTTQKIETRTTASIIKSTTVQNDLTVDEEPIFLKDEPITIKLPESTTVKPVVTDKPKSSKSKKTDKSEEKSESIKLKKESQQPELIDITGRNKQIPDEVKNFKATKISMSIHIKALIKNKLITITSLLIHIHFF